MPGHRLLTLDRRSAGTGLVIFWLAAGVFAFGVGEFASMTLLPSMAADLGASEGAASSAITAYALGVVLGAPVISVFGARWPRKPVLLALLAVLVLSNLFVASAHSLAGVVGGRFVSGIPHGAFIGMAMLMAASISRPDRRTRAVSLVNMGITVATIVGVPLFTAVGGWGGWRLSYVLMAVLAAVAMTALWATAPHTAGNRATSPRIELLALRNPKVLLTLVTGAIGFGGIFAVYSYFTAAFQATGAGPSWAMTLILVLYGVGSTAGTYLAGAVREHVLLQAAMGFQVVLGLAAVLYALGVGQVWLTGAAMVFIGVSGGMVVPLQTRLMVAAGDAQTLAAAMNHVAFNLANALGPALAGAAMGAGAGWSSSGWIAAGLALAGLALLGANVLSDRRTPVTAHAVRLGAGDRDPRTGPVAPVTGSVPVLD